jgi:hypothetical protein
MVRTMVRTGAAAALIVTLAVPGIVRAQEHVRGTVVSLVGDTLQLLNRAGSTVKVELAADTKVARVDRADPGSIAEGEFIGTTAVPQAGGRLRALEVHVFPESMRGTGEGHRPWDLAPGSTMTNAMVAAAKSGKMASSMTNATVGKMGSAGGVRTLRLSYRGGEQTVDVPAGTPVVKLEPGDRSDLAKGVAVFVIATKGAGGALVAQRISAGRNGVVPPM